MTKTGLTIAAFVFLFISQSMIMRRDGTDPGYTGSPGDSFKNCTVCHGGLAIPIDGLVSSNIPSGGYVAGQTYTIRAVNYEMGATRFGFQVSPQDSQGNLLGTIIISDSLRTKLVGDSKYITYTENGVENIDSAVWTFQWKAPDKTVNDVTFYAAFNSNQGHKGGDHTYLSTLNVKRDNSNAIREIPQIQSVKVYPNPTGERILVKFDLKSDSRVLADIIDLNGKQVAMLMNAPATAGPFSGDFNVSSLAEGQYVVRISINGRMFSYMVTIAR